MGDDEEIIFKAHPESVKSIYCSPNNPRIFCTGAEDGFCKMWDRRTLEATIALNKCSDEVVMSIDALKFMPPNHSELLWRAKFSPERTGHRFIYT
ncbi:unnamed protein product, partial [Thelazia callipaeda]|uniref:WD_REPEATS_REGION domain-containing protein n=1 Tax=Thelazia callipaeda TaxID=103827 RepID=A0A0N5D6C2_THECL